MQPIHGGIANGSNVLRGLFGDGSGNYGDAPPSVATPAPAGLAARAAVSAMIAAARLLIRDIDHTWPDFASRPGPAVELETTLQTTVVELERCLRDECVDFEAMVATGAAGRCRTLAEGTVSR